MKETYILWFHKSKGVLVLIFINKILILSFTDSKTILCAVEKCMGFCYSWEFRTDGDGCVCRLNLPVHTAWLQVTPQHTEGRLRGALWPLVKCGRHRGPACSAHGSQKKALESLEMTFRHLWAGLGVLGIEPGSSERAASVCNHWDISPASWGTFNTVMLRVHHLLFVVLNCSILDDFWFSSTWPKHLDQKLRTIVMMSCTGWGCEDKKPAWCVLIPALNTKANFTGHRKTSGKCGGEAEGALCSKHLGQDPGMGHCGF